MSRSPATGRTTGHRYDEPVLSADELRARADALGWFHRIDLGQGVETNGLSSGPYVGPDKLPELAGKSVLDIGAWDGYYSFQAERLGARRVVALDHYVWGVDMAARQQYWAECAASCPITPRTPPSSGGRSFPAGPPSTSPRRCCPPGWSRWWPTSRPWTSRTSGPSTSSCTWASCTT